MEQEAENPESWKLFVGQIPKAMRHEDLVHHFSHYGELQEVFIIRDQATGQSKGCCFVRYRHKQSAEKCIEVFNDKVVFPGAAHPCQVSYASQHNPAANNNNNNGLGRNSPTNNGVMGGAALPPPPPGGIAPAPSATPNSASGSSTQEFESKLFVGQLPPSFKDQDLMALFEEFGTVREVFIMRHRDTGLSKGAGFVRLEGDGSNAKRAIAELNGKTLEGTTVPIKVDFAHQNQRPNNMMARGMMMPGMNGPPRYSMHAPGMMYPGGGNPGSWYPHGGAGQMGNRKETDNLPKLFVGGLTPQTTEAALLQIFSHYGQVREVVVLRFQNGQSKSSGFVKYATEEEADVAVASLSNRYSLPGSPRPLTVRYAGAANAPPEHKLFVGHLPVTFDEAQTAELFRPFGEVIEVHVMRDSRGTTKGSAFVKFSQRSQAEAAIQQLHGSTNFGERPLKVSFAHSRASAPHQMMGQPPLLQQLQPPPPLPPHQMHQQQQRVHSNGMGPQQQGNGNQEHLPMEHVGYTYYPPMPAQYYSVSAGDGSSQLPLSF